MRVALVSDMANVVRFPVERRARPTMELLRQIAPDVREVLQVIKIFELDMSIDSARQAADAETASHISSHMPPEPGDLHRYKMGMLLMRVVRRAMEACGAAHDASVAAIRTHQRSIQAQAESGHWVAPREEHADELSRSAARLVVHAHICVEQAEGAARAVGIAMRGETWAPFNLETEIKALFCGRRSA